MSRILRAFIWDQMKDFWSSSSQDIAKNELYALYGATAGDAHPPQGGGFFHSLSTPKWLKKTNKKWWRIFFLYIYYNACTNQKKTDNDVGIWRAEILHCDRSMGEDPALVLIF